MSLIPQIILGNINTGQRGDSSFEAYNKFNIHEHNNSYSGNFLSLGIKVGFTVTGIYQDTELFNSAEVISVSSTEIILSEYSLINAPVVDLIFSDPFSTDIFIIKNLNITTTNNVISSSSVSQLGGNLTINQAKRVDTLLFTGHIPFTNANTVFSLIIKNAQPFYVTRLDLIAQHGNANLHLIKNNTNLLSNLNITINSVNSFSCDEQTTSYSSYVDVDDHVKLQFVSFTGTPYVSYNLYGILV
jgi:hypothetical protein